VEQSPGTTTAYGGNGGSAASLTEQAKQQTQQALQKTRQTASQLADQAKQQVRDKLATQKDRASEGLGSIAQALQQTGEQLSQQDQGTVGQYAHTVADQIERFSTYLRDKNVDQLLGEAENLARRQPGVFIGGAFALGFLAARLLKSSSPPRYDYPYTTGSEGAVLYPQPSGTTLQSSLLE